MIILTLTQPPDSFFEACATTDLAIHAPGTITASHRDTTDFPRGVFCLLEPFCQFKRHKRLHTLPSSLYKSSTEEDSRCSDVLKPNLKGVIHSKALSNMSICVCIHHRTNFSSRDEAVQLHEQSGVKQKRI